MSERKFAAGELPFDSAIHMVDIGTFLVELVFFTVLNRRKERPNTERGKKSLNFRDSSNISNDLKSFSHRLICEAN